jgi:hypothetical protein
MQDPCCSSPARALDIVILDTPRGDLIDVSSSSYNLSIFSSKAVSRNDGVQGRTEGVIECKYRGSLA